MYLNKKIQKVVTILILFSVWSFLTALTLLQIDDLTSTTNAYEKAVFTELPNGELLRGQTVEANIIVRENYLGQVSVRFYNYDRINSDEVLFRIREKGASEWYYQNTYRTDQFQPHALFPFGFPIIADSKGKSYVIQIESVNGAVEDAVTLSNNVPLLTTGHQYPKKDIVTNANVLSDYLKNKVIFAEYNHDTVIALIKFLTFVLLSTFLTHVFLVNVGYKVSAQWLKSGTTIIMLGIFLLIVNMVLLSLNEGELSYMVATMSYFILVIGVMVKLIEIKIYSRSITRKRRKKHEKNA